MADFCSQCSVALFGEDHGDFADPLMKAKNKDGFFTVGLCEGCGPTMVDSQGRCVSEDCLKRHGRDVK